MNARAPSQVRSGLTETQYIHIFVQTTTFNSPSPKPQSQLPVLVNTTTTAAYLAVPTSISEYPRMYPHRHNRCKDRHRNRNSDQTLILVHRGQSHNQHGNHHSQPTCKTDRKARQPVDKLRCLLQWGPQLVLGASVPPLGARVREAAWQDSSKEFADKARALLPEVERGYGMRG